MQEYNGRCKLELRNGYSFNHFWKFTDIQPAVYMVPLHATLYSDTQFTWFVCLMVFNATFNNISYISWRSVLLVEETRGPGENHQPVASH